MADMNVVRPGRVSVIGAGTCDAVVFETARTLGSLLARWRPVVVLGHFGSIAGVIAAETPQQAAAVVQSLLAIKDRAESY